MRIKNAPLVDVVRRQNKEQKITEFLRDHITLVSDCSPSLKSGSKKFLLLARSPASPVAKAFVALSDGIWEAGIAVRVIFTQVGSGPESTDWIDGKSILAFARDIRIAADAALLDAHEQLVLCDETSWIGDSMRRDPSRSDAYECYAAQCRSSAQFATRSFDRLWQISAHFAAYEELSHDSRRDHAGSHDEPHMVTAELPQCDDDSEDPGPMAATRH